MNSYFEYEIDGETLILLILKIIIFLLILNNAKYCQRLLILEFF